MATHSAETDHALFSGEVQGLIVSCHENERPPCGLAGLLDWRFHGAISRYLMAGAITGKPGECAYLPITRHGITYHVVLVGGGSSSAPGARGVLPAESLKALQKNLPLLKVAKFGLSRADLGSPTIDALAKTTKGVALWIAP